MAMTTQKKTFHQADFATKLRVLEGAEYIDANSYEDVKAGLEQGLAVHVESCVGRAFVWKADGKFKADLYYLSPAKAFEFDTIQEAADWTSELCEGSAITD